MTLLLFMLAFVISCILFKFVFLSVVQKDDNYISTEFSGSHRQGTDERADRTLAKAGHSRNGVSQNGSIETTQSPRAESICFDPNTADAETLLRVGFRPWQVKNIMKYRAKGGRYHRKEDVKRIYGLTYGQWDHIEPLIRIDKENQYIADNEDLSYKYDNRSTITDTTTTQQSGIVKLRKEERIGIVKLRKGEKIDINKNDTVEMQRIPGIGTIKAGKLSAYLKRMGGLASADQLNDDALRDMPFDLEDYIIIDATKVHKIHINRLTAKQMSSHPYLSWSQARQIADRVRLYGPLKDWNELLFLSEISETDKTRLEPYISFE